MIFSKVFLKQLFFKNKYLINYIFIGFISVFFFEIYLRNILILNNINKFYANITSLSIGIIFAFYINFYFNFKVPKKYIIRSLFYFTVISFFSYAIQEIANYIIDIDLSFRNKRLFFSSIFFLIGYLLHRKFTFVNYRKIGVALYPNETINIEKIYKNISQLMDFIHIDIVDNTFNKNNSSTIEDYKIDNIKKYWPHKEIHAHIMSKVPYKWINKIYNKVNIVYFHFNIDENVDDLFKLCKKLNLKIGLVVTTKEDLENIKKYIIKVERILLLTIDTPGFSGQKFNEKAYEYIKKINNINNKIILCVDGGVNLSNIKKLNCEEVVTGSFILNSDKPKNDLIKLFNTEYF